MIIPQPILATERLVLRPLDEGDAERVRLLAGSREVAATTLHIPHPYPEGAAEAWIAATREQAVLGTSYTFAITRREDGLLVGCMGLSNSQAQGRGELGYWIGQEYWGLGYATEAARAVVAFGFAQLHLERIWAAYISGNRASGRVMEKVGMTYEGTQRQHVQKWGERFDLLLYGMLRSEFQG